MSKLKVLSLRGSPTAPSSILAGLSALPQVKEIKISSTVWTLSEDERRMIADLDIRHPVTFFGHTSRPTTEQEYDEIEFWNRMPGAKVVVH